MHRDAVAKGRARREEQTARRYHRNSFEHDARMCKYIEFARVRECVCARAKSEKRIISTFHAMRARKWCIRLDAHASEGKQRRDAFGDFSRKKDRNRKIEKRPEW